jgi:hypothetical protein
MGLKYCSIGIGAGHLGSPVTGNLPWFCRSINDLTIRHNRFLAPDNSYIPKKDHMKRLVFGCGFLGSPVGNVCSSAGDEVLGITRKHDRFAELEAAGIRPILGDITNPATLVGLPVVDTVLVAVGMDRTVYSDIRTVYVDGLQHILEALPTETGHLIYISSTGVYGNSNNQKLCQMIDFEFQYPDFHAGLRREFELST